MKRKPLVCLIDSDEVVKEGWLQSLRNDAQLDYFHDHLGVFKQAAHHQGLIGNYDCIIMSRYFQHLNLDVCTSAIPETLRSSGGGPLFLNWQGYIAKDLLACKFDGKLFHKYGVRWQTLRHRILQTAAGQKNRRLSGARGAGGNGRRRRGSAPSKPERCNALLRTMADKATGVHRDKIAFYAERDQGAGIALLEAIYDRLLTDKNRPDTCPSRYINSSPVIAQRILRETLYAREPLQN